MRTRPYLRTLIYHAQGNGITFPLASTHLLGPIIWEIGIGVQLYGISVQWYERFWCESELSDFATNYVYRHSEYCMGRAHRPRCRSSRTYTKFSSRSLDLLNLDGMQRVSILQ